MFLTLEVDRETDRRFMAEVPDLPGVLAYGVTEQEAVAHVQALALRVLDGEFGEGDQIVVDVDADRLGFSKRQTTEAGS